MHGTVITRGRTALAGLLAVYRESLPPLAFDPRPQRNLTPGSGP